MWLTRIKIVFGLLAISAIWAQYGETTQEEQIRKEESRSISGVLEEEKITFVGRCDASYNDISVKEAERLCIYKSAKSYLLEYAKNQLNGCEYSTEVLNWTKKTGECSAIKLIDPTVKCENVRYSATGKVTCKTLPLAELK